MQFDIEYWIEALRAGIDLVPAPIAAMILLGGPTAGWLLYRFVVQPRHSRMRGLDPSALWVCANCRSVNAMRLERCYRCDSLPDGEDLEVIDPHPAGPVRLLPVGPGLDLGGGRGSHSRPRPVTQIGRADAVWAEDVERRPALREVAEMDELIEAPGYRRATRSNQIPVGPGRPSAGGRPGAAPRPAPAVRPAPAGRPAGSTRPPAPTLPAAPTRPAAPARPAAPTRPAAPARPQPSGRPAAHRPAIVRPRRAVVVGPSQDPDDSPAA